MKPVRSLVIVGGGTAGWMTAGVLAARFRPRDADGLSVTLVESPTIAAIGVGEGTWPSMRETLQAMGISELDFLVQCDATFKQASKFQDWLRPGHSYYHPFTAPRRFEEISLADDWLAGGRDLDFADFVSFQPALCEQDRAPKTLGTPEYQPVANYAYHLDAVKFADFLKHHCVEKLGVRHVVADVEGVQSDEDGYVTGVRLAGGETLGGDLFVDCTGMGSLLVGRHFGSGLTDVKDQLFVDTALAIQVPYDTPAAPIRSATLSTAQSAGWIWDIGLHARRGTGYVYSSAFASEDEARATLSAYLGDGRAGENARRIAINAGYRKTPWVRNCVAIGLSMGFVEPLEASSIVMIELAAKALADRMPASRADMDVLAPRFNAAFAGRWAAIVDFLKLHYSLSQRDEPFWVANRQPETLSGTLRDLLQLWATRTPGIEDFPHRAEIFPAASYQYVLYGMAFDTRVPAWRTFGADRRRHDLARQEVERARTSAAQLPANRAFLQTLLARHPAMA
ncbi:tryptophan halogenase family protein [Asticcacaulis solisilvae]|uniref:tryptophan halogenase family protein n=1 Tax=Asticcacaulis solisilvae TaxID=1217274 RepID=UPI003FD8DDBA